MQEDIQNIKQGRGKGKSIRSSESSSGAVFFCFVFYPIFPQTVKAIYASHNVPEYPEQEENAHLDENTKLTRETYEGRWVNKGQKSKKSWENCRRIEKYSSPATKYLNSVQHWDETAGVRWWICRKLFIVKPQHFLIQKDSDRTERTGGLKPKGIEKICPHKKLPCSANMPSFYYCLSWCQPGF